ncbi:hypothetical protein RUM44_012325 [Polyplax serrata]|uniref:Uncharacterized protein n=1 Tax=Polyplax serrata TaxID=468196 RepID=A0ABR1BF13_POLSC
MHVFRSLRRLFYQTVRNVRRTYCVWFDDITAGRFPSPSLPLHMSLNSNPFARVLVLGDEESLRFPKTEDPIRTGIRERINQPIGDDTGEQEEEEEEDSQIIPGDGRWGLGVVVPLVTPVGPAGATYDSVLLFFFLPPQVDHKASQHVSPYTKVSVYFRQLQRNSFISAPLSLLDYY